MERNFFLLQLTVSRNTRYLWWVKLTQVGKSRKRPIRIRDLCHRFRTFFVSHVYSILDWYLWIQILHRKILLHLQLVHFMNYAYFVYLLKKKKLKLKFWLSVSFLRVIETLDVNWNLEFKNKIEYYVKEFLNEKKLRLWIEISSLESWNNNRWFHGRRFWIKCIHLLYLTPLEV